MLSNTSRAGLIAGKGNTVIGMTVDEQVCDE